MSSSGLLLGLLAFFVSQYQHGAIACKHGELVPKNTLMTWYPADDCNTCECWKGAWDCSHYECISGGPKDEKLGSLNGSLYTFLKERRSWDGVRRFCQENGGDLAVINSTEEGTYLKEILKDKGLVGPYDAIFIGASAKPLGFKIINLNFSDFEHLTDAADVHKAVYGSDVDEAVGGGGVEKEGLQKYTKEDVEAFIVSRAEKLKENLYADGSLKRPTSGGGGGDGIFIGDEAATRIEEIKGEEAAATVDQSDPLQLLLLLLCLFALILVVGFVVFRLLALHRERNERREEKEKKKEEKTGREEKNKEE